jgi:5-methylcytosine-specific restriction protein A
MGTLSSPDKRIRGRRGVELRKRRLTRTKGLCEHCYNATPRRITIATVVNHIKPLAHGGEDTDENTENLCAECDALETARVFGRRIKQRISVDGWPVEG